jgi:hypothetical protein
VAIDARLGSVDRVDVDAAGARSVLKEVDAEDGPTAMVQPGELVEVLAVNRQIGVGRRGTSPGVRRVFAGVL